MNTVFRRMPLMAKLLIIAFVPLLFIGYLTLDLYSEKSNNLSQIKAYLDRVRQSAAISRLTDQLQKERRYSFDFVLTKSHYSEMIAQRPQTTRFLNELKKQHDKSLKDFSSYTFLEKLDSVRNLMDRSQFDANQVMHFYSSSIFRLNTINKIPSLNNPELENADDQMTSQRLLSELSTYLGIISANVYNVLYTRKYVLETLFGTYPSWEVYKTYEKEFAVKTNKNILNQFKNFQTFGALHSVDTYLDKLFNDLKVDSSYTYESWSNVADNALSELRNLQMRLLKNAESKVSDYYMVEYQSRKRTVTYLALMIIMLTAMVGYILYIINQTLKNLKVAAIRLSDGETNLGIVPESNDFIGNLAHSIHLIDEKNQELAIAAQQIGNGNFEVPIKPRSSSDMLGNAVVNMQQELLHYTDDLKKSRDEFETLADFMPQIVWVTDAKGQLTYHNRKWLEVTGVDTMKNQQDWLLFLHPDDMGKTIASWHQAVKSGSQYEVEYRIKDVRTNEYRWFLARAIPVKDASNQIVKWFGTTTDIDDQKMQEKRLEDIVRERTIELDRSNHDLQQFAHVASHDLKEPARKIRTFSDHLEQEIAASISEKGKIYLEKIKATSERMGNMIDGILNYSVISATEKANEIVDLNSIIEIIKSDLELVIVQKKATILHDHLPTVKGTSTLCHQMFYNLIANALKFSKTDIPPVIKIKTTTVLPEEVIEQIERKKCETYLHISIEDNGIGFNQQYADRMFNAFTRLNGKAAYEGTGLGLALCKKIVQRHDGSIYATGKEGMGAVFHVILPNYLGPH